MCGKEKWPPREQREEFPLSTSQPAEEQSIPEKPLEIPDE